MSSSKRVFLIMIGVVTLLSGLAIATLVGGDMYLRKQAKKLTDLKLENRLLDEQQTALIQANKDIAKYADLEKIAKSVVPQDKDQARAVRDIIQIASDSGISISSVSFPSSNLGQGSSSSSSSSATSGSTSTAKPTTNAISQGKAVEGIPGVYALEMTILPNSGSPVSYDKFLKFLERLENNRRTAQVTKIKVDPVGSDPKSLLINFTLTINIFVKP